MMKRRGAPKKHHMLKKQQVSLQLPKWIIYKLYMIPEPRQKIIEQAIIEKFGWDPDNINENEIISQVMGELNFF